MFVAVVLHKLPEGLAIASLFLAAGSRRRRGRARRGALGVTTLLGVLLTDPRAAAGDVRARALGRRHAVRRGIEPRAGVPVQAGLALRALLLWRVRACSRCALDVCSADSCRGAATDRGRADPLFSAPSDRPQPLAARMRPRTLDEFVGPGSTCSAPGKPLRDAIEQGTVGSMILWGPPGTGKTTLGHLVAHYTDREFVPFSAVTEGVPRVREIVAEAAKRGWRWGAGRSCSSTRSTASTGAAGRLSAGTSRAGTVTLIGATTENPSFEINGALLSRARVFVLQPLTPDDIAQLLRRALADAERGLGAMASRPSTTTRSTGSRSKADGDARRALTVLEAAARARRARRPR